MEHPSDPRYISRDQKCISAAKRSASLPTRRRTKLRDIMMSDKPDFSSADLHQKLTGHLDDAITDQKLTPKEDELVRYMSNLPSYLAKGNGFSDKALNFGVLDWKRLEKWQYKQQMSQKHDDCSPSSSGASVFSTDGSSTHSSRGQSYAGSRDGLHLCRSSPKVCVVESGSGSVIAASDKPSSNQSSSNNNRSRSSPLRRLLEPIFKSRASHRSEPSQTIGTMKSCNESQRQALLQVSFKNGFPLFTFAIDDESNILAATVRKSFVPGNGHHNWTYTFFTVHEVKRKSGIWLNHGGKGDGPSYVPNVVAQMKVSDSLESPFSMKDGADDVITREFDLFAVDVGNGDHYGTDFHPTNELAAIVVKLPSNSGGDDLKDGQSSYNWLDFQNHNSIGSPSSSMTAVLPGGVHTIPSKGEISTLAQRWRSGGSCDCGGWDLGCQLRVYTNQRSYNRSDGSYPDRDNCRLFSQGDQENKPAFSLTPFKERIYSVEFNSSLSLLQAFAICISFIDCGRLVEVADPRNAVDKIDNEIGVFEVPLPIKTSNHQVGTPARYISYPPNSPVGRV